MKSIFNIGVFAVLLVSLFSLPVYAADSVEAKCGVPAKDPYILSAHFHKCWAEGNVEGLGAYYDENSVFISEQGKKRVRITGVDNILKQLRTYVKLSADTNSTLANPYKVVEVNEAGDMALVTAAWVIRDADGSQVLREAVATEVYVKTKKGNWVYAIDDPFHPLLVHREHLLSFAQN